MRAIVITGPGQAELNWSWLPTWIGINGALKKEIEKDLSNQIVGKPLDDRSLDEASELVIDFLCKKFPLEGLRDYLDGLKFVVER